MQYFLTQILITRYWKYVGLYSLSQFILIYGIIFGKNTHFGNYAFL